MLGLGYVFIIPPFEAPDEPAHFLRAWSVAEKQWVLVDHPKKAAVFILDEMSKRHDIENHALLNDMLASTQKDNPRIPNFAFNSSLYSPLPFIFQAAAIKFMSAIQMQDHLSLVFYSCRIVSLVIFTGFLFFAFIRLENWSWPVFWVACTPMALSQASVISIDGILFGATAVMAAIALKPRGRTDFVLLVICLLFLGLTKSTYLILAFFPFILAYYCREFRFVFFFGILSAILSAAAWHIIMSQHVVNYSLELMKTYAFREVDPQAQIKYVMENPLGFMGILYDSVVRNFITHLRQFIGVLGWLNIYLPKWIYILWSIFAVGSIFSITKPATSRDKFFVITGLWGISVSFITCMAIFISLYLIWMPVGALSIEVQGRYFHAPAIVALLCLSMVTPAIKWVDDISIYLFPVSAIVFNLISLATLSSFYNG
jgi:uncharacterized membrane protein